VERERRGEEWEGNRIEGKRREWKRREGERRGGEGMNAPGAGPPKIFGLEPPLCTLPSMYLSDQSTDRQIEVL
jgi:hypothetical protein